MLLSEYANTAWDLLYVCIKIIEGLIYTPLGIVCEVSAEHEAHSV